MTTKKTTEKSHNEGSDFTHESTTPNGPKSVADRAMEIADTAIDEVSTYTGKVIKDEEAQRLTAGAAVGALAGVLLPFVTLPVGAVAGLGYVLYRNSQKNK